MDNRTKEFIIKKLENRRERLISSDWGFSIENSRKTVKDMEQRLERKGINVDYSMGSDLGISIEYHEGSTIDILKKELARIEKAEAEVAELDKAIEAMRRL